jgi:hypothetical protein
VQALPAAEAGPQSFLESDPEENEAP